MRPTDVKILAFVVRYAGGLQKLCHLSCLVRRMETCYFVRTLTLQVEFSRRMGVKHSLCKATAGTMTRLNVKYWGGSAALRFDGDFFFSAQAVALDQHIMIQIAGKIYDSRQHCTCVHRQNVKI